MRRRLVFAIVLIVVLALTAATANAKTVRIRIKIRPPRQSVVVFNGEAEDLNAYDVTDGFRKQVVVDGDEKTKPLALNGQICFSADHRTLVMGDDAGQPARPPGWVVLRLEGHRVGHFKVKPLARLVPTYQADPENYGCGILSDGRILTTDVGNQQFGAATGQLIEWFPPFDGEQIHYCKLDIALATGQGIAVDSHDRIYVAAARPPMGGVFRYTGPFPTSDTAEGGCGRKDATGAPLADSVTKERFIPTDSHAVTPNAIVRSPRGTFYVSSILNGVIAEYDADGHYIRTVLAPPSGESFGSKPFSTGTPLGLGIDSHGTIYYADLGLVVDDSGIGPGHNLGTVRQIRFKDGEPLPPETIDTGLDFPDGIGVLELTGQPRIRVHVSIHGHRPGGR